MGTFSPVLKFASSIENLFQENLQSYLEEPVTESFIVCTTFPLSLYSKDSSVNFRHFASISPEEPKLYIKLIQFCSNSFHDSNSSLDKLTSQFDNLPASVINQLDSSQGAAPLHYACMHGNLPLVSYLLGKGANPTIWDQNRAVTPLCCAAAFGHLEICKLLLTHNQCQVSKASALHWAVLRSHPPIVELLIEHNCIPEVVLNDAVVSGNTEILELLLSKIDKSKAQIQYADMDTPLHLAASGNFPNSLETIRILIDDGTFPVNIINGKQQTPLHIAVASYDPEIVSLLISNWASVKVEDENWKTPLFYAISDDEDALDCLRELIEKGHCNVNHQDRLGYTALHLAGLEGAEEAAQLLLLNGADFSIKSCNGTTALSFLRRTIPHINTLISKVFDNAVTVNIFHTGDKKECKVSVNFDCVLPADSMTAAVSPHTQKFCPGSNSPTNWVLESSSSEDPDLLCRRKDTAKLKCLLDENEEDLLLHPVAHAFLSMKWQKARSIFMPSIIYKCVLALLFSAYVYLPYHNLPKRVDPENAMVYACDLHRDHDKPVWYDATYYAIITLYALKLIMEFAQVTRAPKLLRSIYPWISVAALFIMWCFASPKDWRKAACPLQRSMASVGILLTWIDLWAELCHFPQFGMSIRVFFQVLKKFCVFLTPHLFLLVGFVLSFTMIFQKFPEFYRLVLTLPKLARIMAGDITIVSQAHPMMHPDNMMEQHVTEFIMVYIYTGYVIIVSIVLSNLLIGLAVSDMQNIQAQASKNKLVKQTILLNTIETTLSGRWVDRWMPWLRRCTNLFDADSESKTLIFKPYDVSDKRLNAEEKKELLDIATVVTPASKETVTRLTSSMSGKTNSIFKPQLSYKKSVRKLRRSSNADEELKELMDKINECVSTYLKKKSGQSSLQLPTR